ncbi:MAG TPA: prepilin-type N-terminal cleavage/methylation domain-containing protein [Vicinamibacteria bacterium]|nr:prepilin-type N-terminal cleavage/methylation domain-containing protein [Vicinamibacteria bacterium]
MTVCDRAAGRRKAEAGFTLVEVLTAMVILIFGLMAVTNLLLVAASSNTVANQSTAAAASASRIMDRLKDASFPTLAAGGSVTVDTPGGVPAPCGGEGGPWPGPPPVAVNAPAGLNNCDDDIPGVGKIHTRWAINAIPGTARTFFIQVRSEGTGALAGARSRAEFTTLRSCTEPTGCPAPP